MLKKYKLSRLSSGFGALMLLAGLATQAILPSTAVAASQITNRSLTLETNGVDANSDGIPDAGGSLPGGTVNHLFKFTLNDLSPSDTVGSITFQYCTTAAAVPNGVGCIAPTGVSTQNATIASQSGANGFVNITNSSLDDTSSTGSPDGIYNLITIERTSAAALVTNNGNGTTDASYELDTIVNPATAQTFFVRITTHSGTDGTGTAFESGSVAAATSTAINLSGKMPESLVFCAGAKVGLTNSVPDCGTVTTGDVSFDRLFSPTDTALATSQMAASTNAGQGYAITVNGPTLLSGSNQISPISSADQSKHGVSQFGLNLALNDGTAYTNAPNLADMSVAQEANSADVSNPSDGANLNGRPYPGYDAGGMLAGSFVHNGTFKYHAGDVVADSGYNTGTPKGSDAQIFTVSYIANVPGSQPAGTYSTTLTYICTPTF